MVQLEGCGIVEVLEANLAADMARRVDLVVIEGNLIRERDVTEMAYDRSSRFEGLHLVVGLSANLNSL